MKKNYNLFKSIIVCFLVFIVLSWIIPTGSITEGAYKASTIKPVGLFGLFYYPTVGITTFIQFGVIALVIGGFYGVLNQTGAYQKLIDKIVAKKAGNEKLFLILTIVGFTLMSSIIGVQYGILVFVPFFVGILLKMGFNNITALAATIGSMLTGSIASTYSYTVGTQIAQLLKTDVNDQIIFKFAFLIIVLFLYMLFVTGNTKAVLRKKKKKEEEIIIPFAEVKITTKKQTKALSIMLIAFGLLLFLGMTNWKYMFGIEVFEKFHESIAQIKVGELPILASIINISNPIGYWTSNELVVMLLLFSYLIGWIYNLKFDEIIEGFATGSKRMFKTSFLMVFASVIFVLMLMGSDGTMFITIANKLSTITAGFNFLFTSIMALISGFFYNDFYYALNSISEIVTRMSGEKYILAAGFIFQTMHGIMMMIMPTSLILVAGLSMFDVSFKEWIKYIYKFVLQLLAISLIISVILVLIV